MWQILKRAEIPLRVGMAIALAYLGYVFLARHTGRGSRPGQPSAEAEAEAVAKYRANYGGTALKIIQFYASDAAILEDHSTNICYGLLNAKSVRVDPPIGELYPALNRCVSVSPKHDTQYTMTAEGTDGTTATAQFTIKVSPDVASLPRVTRFEMVKHTVERGVHYFTIEFAFENASTVMVDPPAFKPLEDSAPWGKFIATPDRTTTYTLTVVDKKGHKATKQLTLEVK